MSFHVREVVDKFWKDRHFQLSINISIKNKFLFVSNSKCASSTIKYYLQKKEFEGSYFDVEDIKDVDDKKKSPLISPFQLDEAALGKALFSDQFKRFAFVRDPYARVAANYLYKIIKVPGSAPAREFRRLSGKSGEISFLDFVEFICSQKDKYMNPHWKPLSSCMMMPDVKYDFIGKVENLREDLVSLGKVIYGEGGYEIDGLFDAAGRPLVGDPSGSIAPCNNPLNYQHDHRDNWAKLYCQRSIDLVGEKYRQDFDGFGYERM